MAADADAGPRASLQQHGVPGLRHRGCYTFVNHHKQWRTPETSAARTMAVCMNLGFLCGCAATPRALAAHETNWAFTAAAAHTRTQALAPQPGVLLQHAPATVRMRAAPPSPRPACPFLSPSSGAVLPHGWQRGVLIRGKEDRGLDGELPEGHRWVVAVQTAAGCAAVAVARVSCGQAWGQRPGSMWPVSVQGRHCGRCCGRRRLCSRCLAAWRRRRHSLVARCGTGAGRVPWPAGSVLSPADALGCTHGVWARAPPG